jgi:hypothetical protein
MEKSLLDSSREIHAISKSGLAFSKDPFDHFYKIYLICDFLSGMPTASVETSEIAFFSRTDVADLKLDPGRITRTHALRMFDHYAQPSLPADFAKNYLDPALFEDVFLSHRLGMVKPDLRLFEYVLETIGCPPSNCVFIDDTPRNVEAACTIGINGCVFTSTFDLSAELARLREIE